MRTAKTSGCRTAIIVGSVVAGMVLGLLLARPLSSTTQKAVVAVIDPTFLKQPVKKFFGAIKAPIP